MRVVGEISYASSKRNVLNGRGKLGVQPFAFDALDLGDAVSKMQQLLEKGKKLLPKKVDFTTCNCVVVRTTEKLEGLQEPLQFIYDRVLDEAASFNPRSLEEYTPEQKIAAFEKLHRFAMSVWNDHKKGEGNEDDSHYAYEEIMKLLAREGQTTKEFWESFNALGELASGED
jgi:hypothetical protein